MIKEIDESVTCQLPLSVLAERFGAQDIVYNYVWRG